MLFFAYTVRKKKRTRKPSFTVNKRNGKQDAPVQERPACRRRQPQGSGREREKTGMKKGIARQSLCKSFGY